MLSNILFHETNSARLPQIHAEHPYNLSFIQHQGMQALFGPMELLRLR